MNKQFILVAILVVSITAFITIDEAEAKGTHSGTARVECIGSTPPLITTNVVPIDELTYSLSIEVTQGFGKCWYKNENSHLYALPFMPLKYEIDLIDTDFDAVTNSHMRVGGFENKFSNGLWEVYETIPYCIQATSYWMDASERTFTTESRMCFTL